MTESRDPSSTDGHGLAEETGTGDGELLHLRELTARLQEENRELNMALESRVAIEQAKGVLGGRGRSPLARRLCGSSATRSRPTRLSGSTSDRARRGTSRA